MTVCNKLQFCVSFQCSRWQQDQGLRVWLLALALTLALALASALASVGIGVWGLGKKQQETVSFSTSFCISYSISFSQDSFGLVQILGSEFGLTKRKTTTTTIKSDKQEKYSSESFVTDTEKLRICDFVLLQCRKMSLWLSGFSLSLRSLNSWTNKSGLAWFTSSLDRFSPGLDWFSLV